MNINLIISLSIVLAVATLLVPIAIAFTLFYKRKCIPKTFFLGALTFGVAQVILRMPIMNILSATTDWFGEFIQTIPGMIIIGGLTAGIFEETARLIVAKTALKEKTDFTSMFSFALGYGFCEVALIVGTVAVNTLVNAVMLKNGSIDAMLSSGQVTAEGVTALKQALSTITVQGTIMSILERISAVGLHLFFTALVFRVVNDKNIIWYFVAILAHTVTNSVIIIPAPLWVIEAILLLLSAMGVFAVIKMKATFPVAYTRHNHTPEKELTM